MSEICMMVTITNRSHAPGFLAFYKEYQIGVSLVTLGAGTANSEMLDTFGLEATEKAVMFSFTTRDVWREVKTGLYKKLKIDATGAGIAFLIPMSSIGGKKALNFLMENQNFEKGEEATLKETRYELLIAVANQGHIDTMMDAARSVGAGGGTVIHAKGTGMEKAEKFFGISLATEKEMLFIVTRREQKNDIMKAIMEQAGPTTKAGAIVFSLPVSSTAGLRMIEEEMAEA